MPRCRRHTGSGAQSETCCTSSGPNLQTTGSALQVVRRLRLATDVALTAAPGDRDALEGKGPQRRSQQRLDRQLEEVTEAVGGGYCRLQMPLKLALAIRGTVAGHGWGGGGGLPPFQCRYQFTGCPRHRQFQPLVQWFLLSHRVPFLVGVLHYRMYICKRWSVAGRCVQWCVHCLSL